MFLWVLVSVTLTRSRWVCVSAFVEMRSTVRRRAALLCWSSSHTAAAAQDAALTVPWVAFNALRRDVRAEEEEAKQQQQHQQLQQQHTGRELLAGVADLRMQGETRDFDPERCAGCMACLRFVRGKQ